MAGEAFNQHPPDFPVLIREGEIRQKVGALAQRIAGDHPPDQVMLIVGILKGSLVFVADLVRQLTCPLEIELVRMKSYDGARPGGEVQIEDGFSVLDLEGKHVLLVDTILDTGRKYHSS